MNQDYTNKKSGYLHQDFRLFHLKDRKNQEFEFHYHDFNKILVFLSGNVTYLIEGKFYRLQPWDVLLVNNHNIHKPMIDSSQTYERIIIWLQPEFIQAYSQTDCDLTSCFQQANEHNFHLLRFENSTNTHLQTLIKELELSLSSKQFGSNLLSNTYFLQFMIYLNRAFLKHQHLKDPSLVQYNKQIEEILTYINAHLTQPLTNEALAHKFYLSKYYLMHKFKEETGFTLHSYISQKRLILASDLIKKGTPVLKASEQCGFGDYSSFLRAFRKIFHKSPRDLL